MLGLNDQALRNWIKVAASGALRDLWVKRYEDKKWGLVDDAGPKVLVHSSCTVISLCIHRQYVSAVTLRPEMTA
jgi:hypothetical protein